MEKTLATIEKTVDKFHPIPFYFVNDDFDAEEVCLQLDFMKKNGIKSFFFHVRDGITGEAFGTDLYFEHVKFVVAEAAKRRIKVWLYDEDAYPSGNCGGLTVIEHPELQARTLCVERVPVDENGIARKCVGNRAIGKYGYIVLPTGEVQRVENCFGAVRQTWYQRKLDKHYFADMPDRHFEHTRAATSYTEVMFELQAPQDAEVYCVYVQPVFTDIRYGTQANCIDRRTTEYFIARVHEKYRQYVGEYFGNVIPGIFLDEPATGGNAYSEELEAYFEKRMGYSPCEHYYKLSAEFKGDSAKFRRDYAKVVSELFRKNFLRPLKEWCDAQDLVFTGHFSGEENLSTQAHGADLYRALGELDLPGMDLIGNDMGDLEHCSLLLGAKVVSSSAWQNGKDVIISECFALNPYNFGYQGMKTNADWLFACGVELLVPHAFHYGYSAFRRADAGKSFFFQDPLFHEYKQFANYASRVGRLLHEYRAQNEVLVVLPLSACGEEMLQYRKNAPALVPERMKKVLDRVNNVIKLLYAYHVEFDVTYPDTALEAKMEGGSIRVGERCYSRVIVLEGGEEELAVYNRMKGAIADLSFCSYPHRMNLEEKMLVGLRGNIQNLLVLKKKSEERELYFIFNNDEEYVRFSLVEDGEYCVYDAERDEYLAFGKNKEIGLNGYQSVILVTKDEHGCTERYDMPKERGTTLGYKVAPQRVYLPVGCKAAITEFDLTVQTAEGEKKYEKVGFSRLRDVLGTADDLYVNAYMVPYFDTAPRILAPYPVRAKYTATMKNFGGGILLDKDTISGNYRLFFNGKEIEKKELHKKRVYDRSNVIFYPKWKAGSNLLEIVFDEGGEFDGINGEIFVMEG